MNKGLGGGRRGSVVSLGAGKETIQRSKLKKRKERKKEGGREGKREKLRRVDVVHSWLLGWSTSAQGTGCDAQRPDAESSSAVLVLVFNLARSMSIVTIKSFSLLALK